MKRSFRNAVVFCALVLAPALLFSQASWSGKPVKLSIIDVAGNLKLSKPAIEAFKAANPRMISDIEYIIATAPELVAKIKAQQMAGNLDTTMVLTGDDGMAAGKEQGVWLQVMPKYKAVFEKSINSYLPGARAAYNLFDGYGIAYVFCPGGPMFTYSPDTVKNPPKTAAELLAWAKANPGKFMYARPANSGPGWAFLQGLPYILGDPDPERPLHVDQDLGLPEGAGPVHRLLPHRDRHHVQGAGGRDPVDRCQPSGLGHEHADPRDHPGKLPGFLPREHDLGQRHPVHVRPPGTG